MSLERFELELELDWRSPRQVLGVLLGARVRGFLGACAAAGLCLIQIEPFVPFPQGRLGPVAVTLVGVKAPHAKAPHANYAKGPTKWSEIECVEVRDKYHGPAFKAWCTKFPNPKIFVDVVSCGQMYGFGAYIEWLRAKQAREINDANDAKKASGSLKHLTAFMLLMRKVFGEDTLVRVHNTDVPFFHIKKVR